MSGGNSNCDKCGAPAYIHITSEWTGSSGIRHLCFDCAETEQKVRQRRKRAFNLGAVFIVVGALLVLTSVFADELHAGVGQGFGAWQITGLVAAVVLTGVGAALRVPTVLVIGPCMALVILTVPRFELGGTPGFGLRQFDGCLAGLASIVLGVVIVVLRKRWAESVKTHPASVASENGNISSDPS